MIFLFKRNKILLLRLLLVLLFWLVQSELVFKMIGKKLKFFFTFFININYLFVKSDLGLRPHHVVFKIVVWIGFRRRSYLLERSVSQT